MTSTLVVLVTLGALLGGALGHPPGLVQSGAVGRPAPQPAAGDASVPKAMVGTWELVSLETFPKPGAVDTKLASGRLTVDQLSNIAVRAELDPAQAGATPSRTVLLDFRAKAAITSTGAVTFTGVEQLTPAERLVSEAVEPTGWSDLRIEGEVLKLSTVEEGRRRATLTFKKVSD